MKLLIIFSSLFSIAFVTIIFAIAINSPISWIILSVGAIWLAVWYEHIKCIQIPDKDEGKD